MGRSREIGMESCGCLSSFFFARSEIVVGGVVCNNREMSLDEVSWICVSYRD